MMSMTPEIAIHAIEHVDQFLHHRNLDRVWPRSVDTFEIN